MSAKNFIANELRRDADRNHFVPPGHKGDSYAPFDALAEHLVSSLAEFGYFIVSTPVFGHMGPNDTTESTCRRAAANLYNGYDVGDSNTRAGVARLLESTANAIEELQ